MTDRPQCHGDDTLPLGIGQPSQREIDQAKRTMRHAFVSAPAATGSIYGISVEDLSETDKALAFNWLWMMAAQRQAHPLQREDQHHVRPL